MYVRRKHNKSGTQSVQIIHKDRGKYRVIKSFGCSKNESELVQLENKAKQHILELTRSNLLFESEIDNKIEEVISSLSNVSIRTIGPELIFGSIYNYIGYNAIEDELFRHLVIARLAFPLSKLKTIEYLYRFTGVSLEISQVYRFLDKLNDRLKSQVEQISFAHTLKVLMGEISIVFYDMTTLYFEASDEDDLRKTGFSKDGKHMNPQIFLGLLVGLGGYAIGYDIYEGNIYEGNTLIPFLENIGKKYGLSKPIVVADSGLLSKRNIQALKQLDYKYIIGARIKNEPREIRQTILACKPESGKAISIEYSDNTKLIISYSQARAINDAKNRTKGLHRLEKSIKAGRLNKSSINNKGYNKYLKMSGEVLIEIDYAKFNEDEAWDGLKGYVTNADLSNDDIIDNYSQLWLIEKAFRMSKTDLRIRPIYHRLRGRIEAHISISFVAYTIYKELERVLKESCSTISLKKAAELTHNMYELNYYLPDSKHNKSKLLKMDDQQKELYELILKYPRVSQ